MDYSVVIKGEASQFKGRRESREPRKCLFTLFKMSFYILKAHKFSSDDQGINQKSRTEFNNCEQLQQFRFATIAIQNF